MDKIVIIHPAIGFCFSRVCAEKNATDQEILEICNARNPSGTQGGWSQVLRDDAPVHQRPMPCDDDSERLHCMVVC